MTDKRLVLLITCMTAFITPFLGSSVNIALPSINADFMVPDEALLNWVALGFLLSAAIFVVPFGRIADIIGRKTIFITGLSIVVISSILCSMSSSIHMLILSRAVEGFGSALIFGTSVAILTAAYPMKERGKALGINVALTYLGLSAGPVLGGFITHNIGWRYIYGGMAAYASLVALLALLVLKENERCAENAPFDAVGTALYGAMLFTFMMGLSMVPTIWGGLIIALSLAGMAAFFWWELRNPNPVLKVSVFRKNTVFLFSNLAALINYSATAAIAFLLSLYLHYIQGYDPQSAGLILVAQPIVQAIFSPLSGRLSDKVEPRIVASMGMGLCIIGLALFALLTPSTPLYQIIASLMFLGLGFALFSSPNTNAIMSSVDRCDYGVASGMVSTMRIIGQMLSQSIALLIFLMIMGHTEISRDQSGPLMASVQAAFLVFAGLCVIGLFASLMRGNLRSGATPVNALHQKQ
ncbi:Major Facilitator Superfamily [Methanocella conradii HZ254]|uniref:Major Facilitator Superfamily n=1 Tax=Methanocella conradii (strain DSM 24694 / JCM 17849 / CGMCC 1.5162 / HZ254) TaxID=1041930 RepID=H8I5U9_METCZ|nr:MFS transporter [Methanocella conradii]AFC99766.1 Major Facilitator Superfamily [Methanocella conradii HZ254]MDI6896518.1 MFS transporter [Methanocella conradii]